MVSRTANRDDLALTGFSTARVLTGDLRNFGARLKGDASTTDVLWVGFAITITQISCATTRNNTKDIDAAICICFVSHIILHSFVFFTRTDARPGQRKLLILRPIPTH